MAQFYNITIDEMTKFLTENGFEQIKVEGTFEAVFAKRVDQDGLPLSLRCYTGINPDGESRGCGEDTIHLAIFMKKDGRIVKIAGSKKVLRVAGWKQNLQSRIDSWIENMPKDKCCKCGCPMLPRCKKGEKAPSFVGCSNYPTCKNTRSI